MSYYQKSGFKSVFLEFGPGKDLNWSDLSLILSEIWSVFGLILAILGPEYKVEALQWQSTGACEMGLARPTGRPTCFQHKAQTP